MATNPPEELSVGYRAYEQEYIAALQPPADRCYQDVHAGHLIRRGGLIGTGEEMIAQLKALEEVGLRQIAVQVMTNGRELIKEFSREVIGPEKSWRWRPTRGTGAKHPR